MRFVIITITFIITRVCYKKLACKRKSVNWDNLIN